MAAPRQVGSPARIRRCVSSLANGVLMMSDCLGRASGNAVVCKFGGLAPLPLGDYTVQPLELDLVCVLDTIES